jgi:hypothetical protein
MIFFIFLFANLSNSFRKNQIQKIIAVKYKPIFSTSEKRKTFGLVDMQPVFGLSYRLRDYRKTILKSIEE